MIVHPSEDTALEIAEILLKTGAVLIRPDHPFTLTSGQLSPVYIDGKRLMSFVNYRRRVIEAARKMIIGHDIKCDAIAGIESGSIAYAAFLADVFEKPLIYVRKQPKGFGRDAQIEGVINTNDRVLLVEDVTSTGGSKIKFADVLRGAGAHAGDILTLFYYDSFKGAKTLFQKHDVRLFYLSSWPYVLRVAARCGDIGKSDEGSVREFLKDPEGWSATRLKNQNGYSDEQADSATKKTGAG